MRLRVQVRPELPVEYKEKIAELGGSEAELVIQKMLSRWDVDKNMHRFRMPYQHCRVDLTGEVVVGEQLQVKVIHKLANNKLSEMVLTLRKLHRMLSYVFTRTSWTDLVEADGLKVADVVQVWCFRRGINGELCFALVKTKDDK